MFAFEASYPNNPKYSCQPLNKDMSGTDNTAVGILLRCASLHILRCDSSPPPPHLPFHFGSSVSVWPQGSAGEQPLIVLPSQDFSSLTSVSRSSLQGMYFAVSRGEQSFHRPISASLPPQFFMLIHCYISPLVSKCFGWTASLWSAAHFHTLECRASRCWVFLGVSSTLEICNRMEKSSLNVMFNMLAWRQIITVRPIQENNLGKPHSVFIQ